MGTVDTTSGGPPRCSWRPTEAQLRWAQFHHATNAKRVRERIALLNIQAGGGGTQGDNDDRSGASTIWKNGMEYSQARLQVLQDSEQRYQQRKARIQSEGYRVFAEEEEDGMEEEDDTESLLLAELFQEPPPYSTPNNNHNPLGTGTTRRGRRRKRKKQFRAIYRLLLQKLQTATSTATNSHPSSLADPRTVRHGDRRWTRTGPSAETFLVDGRLDTDLTPWKAGMLLQQLGGYDDEEVASLVQELHRHQALWNEDETETNEAKDSSGTTSFSRCVNSPTWFQEKAKSWVQQMVQHLEENHWTELFRTEILPNNSNNNRPTTAARPPPNNCRIWCHKPTLARLIATRSILSFPHHHHLLHHNNNNHNNNNHNNNNHNNNNHNNNNDEQNHPDNETKRDELLFQQHVLDSILDQLEDDHEGVEDHFSLADPSELVTILESYMDIALKELSSHGTFGPGRRSPPPPLLPALSNQPALLGRLRQSMSLSTKVSELFHSLDVETYATFRRRSQQAQTDGTTSVSSFRVLPTGIRQSLQQHMKSCSSSSSSCSVVTDSPARGPDPPELLYHHESKQDETTVATYSQQTIEDISIDPSCTDLTAKFPPDLLKRLQLTTATTTTTTTDLLHHRLQQTVSSLIHQEWNAALAMLAANPWLAQVLIANTQQFLLHVAVSSGIPPDGLIEELLRLNPSAIYKWDVQGNLPLHYASSGILAAHLGDRFPSGASVRNENGMLPLHMAVRAGCVTAIPTLSGYFGPGLAVSDNEGNLPIHWAAVCPGDRRDVVEMIECLLAEADRQVEENGLRFRQKVPKTLEDDETVDTNVTKDFEDETSNCLIVRNDLGDTPLSLAICQSAGWRVIDALTTHSGGLQGLDEHENTALHLVTSAQYADPAATLAILRKVPEAATIHNEQGVLPIENACMQGFPREVILGLVLVDLPINLDQKTKVELREEMFGESWWYITCDCDDHYVDIVKEVMELCNYEQAKALCFITDGPDVLFRRASPKCKQALANAMRFCGRFELHDEGSEPGTFNAVDYGSPYDPIPEGQRVLLRSYPTKEEFEMDTEVARTIDLDFHYFEEIVAIAMEKDDPKRGSLPNGCKYFASVEKPSLMLSSVVKGMLTNRDCQQNDQVRWRYNIKVFSVLRLVAKSLRRLHSQGFVHGVLSVSSCGKFDDDRWKLMGLLGSPRLGRPLRGKTKKKKNRLSYSAPPESVIEVHTNGRQRCVMIRSDLIAQYSFDVWAYGKLAVEALVGQPLLELGTGGAAIAGETSPTVGQDDDDDACLHKLLHWSEVDVQDIQHELTRVQVPPSAISLIGSCLSPQPEQRPTMEQVLKHNVWSELKETASALQPQRMLV